MNYFANVRKPPPFPRWNDLYFDISPQDSDLWLVLYSEAKNISRALASHILFLRGSGARLIKDNRWGYVMRPDIQPGGFESPEHWRELSRKLLDPWQGEVVRLLKFLRDIHDYTQATKTAVRA